MNSSSVLRRVLFLAALLIPVSGQAVIYTVGSSWICTHRTIQSAVDTARAQPGADVIRVTNSMSYLQQSIEIIDNEDLRIEGGYLGCFPSTAGTTRTRIDGAGGARAPVIRIENSMVLLKNIELINGDAGELGGGIAIGGSFRNKVTLLNVRVARNSSMDGAGISVTGESASLFVDTDSVIEANRAQRNGGGIHCDAATVFLQGLRSRIVGNEALNGGGVHAVDCDVWVTSSPSAEGGTIASNLARDSGGGVHLSRSNLVMYTTDADKPVGLTANRATRFGGAIFSVDSAGELSEAVVDGNSAGAGGGAGWLEARDDFSHFRFFGGAAPWPGGVECRIPRNCNRISNNAARDASGIDQEGAAFLLVGGGSAAVQVNRVEISRASMFGQQGRTLVRGIADDGWEIGLEFRDSEVRGNTVSGNLIELMAPPDEAFDGDGLKVLGTTIAANMIGGPSVLYTRRPVQVDRSIVWQPARRVLSFHSTLPEPEAMYTIASDLQGFAPSPTAAIAAPRFVDAAGGNLRLAPNSPAIDYAPTGLTDHDRDDNLRTLDLSGYPNRYGPLDAGAFEYYPVICCAWGG